MAISIEDALNILKDTIHTLDSEILPIEMTVGRIASEDYVAHFDLPRFDNSAMDGYAVKISDASAVVDSKEIIYAGDNPKMTLKSLHAIKIMTGAPIPDGCEAIVPIENVSVEGTKVRLPAEIKMNHFIRMAGEDIKKGTLFLHKGEEINPYTIASLASQGITHISVTRRIKVAIFSTGDELRPHYDKIEEYQLYNSNSPMFYARSKSLNCDVRFVHTAIDTLENITSSIKSSLDADIIITSGGISVGDKDFTKEAFCNLGMEILIDKIDIKPGRPTIIGKIKKTIIVNLPGNPLASMVNYELFVRPIIRIMRGQKKSYHGIIHTKMKHDYALRGGKYAVILGKYNGETFDAISPQMSGMVSPMQYANSLMLITPNVTNLKSGVTVKIIMINWELCSDKKEVLFNS